jgi:hypothetical protein
MVGDASSKYKLVVYGYHGNAGKVYICTSIDRWKNQNGRQGNGIETHTHTRARDFGVKLRNIYSNNCIKNTTITRYTLS